ncbi:1945_t:CDS:1 [Scutellospora calospora]|uniref:1945_t:CDS:1 n=1 Tax=Scutellospora calospora TaxID=85575 RepID=A0ACA9MTD3_9GLOM|nr:1945_t:CDS:1 [Scutellospora calospora]
MWWIFEFIYRLFFPNKNIKLETEEKSAQIAKLCSEVQEQTSLIEKLERDIRKYQESFYNLHKDYENCNKSLQDEKEENLKLQNLIPTLEQRIIHLEKEILTYYKQNVNLKEEASKYQLALGNATNFRFSDDDPNNTVHLKNDIENLQLMIEDYVTNLKNGVNINFENIKELLQRYTSRSQTSNRCLIKAVLQCHVLKQILSFAEESTSDLESSIISKTDDLIEQIESFSEKRVGSDVFTRVAPIKLRQQVYVILGYRGYANECEHKRHPSLSIFHQELNKTMSKYRLITDPNKKISVEEKAGKLIQEVFRIFKFRFKVQEPVIEMLWIDPGTEIKKEYMEMDYDDKNYNDALVDICFFPLIGKDLNNVKRKVITRAKVFPFIQG